MPHGWVVSGHVWGQKEPSQGRGVRLLLSPSALDKSLLPVAVLLPSRQVQTLQLVIWSDVVFHHDSVS